MLLPDPPPEGEARYDLHLTPIAVLGTFDGDGAIEQTVSVRRTTSGLYVVNQRDHLMLFDSTGTFVRTIGRRGGGPGEFRRISRIEVTEGDTIHTFDGSNQRHTILTPDGSVVRSFRLPMYFHTAIVTTRGVVVLNQAIRTTRHDAYPLHFVLDGEVTGSFGTPSPTARPAALGLLRTLARTPDGGIIAARVDRYLIERFNATGDLVATLTRRTELYEQTGPGSSRAPGTSTNAVGVDDDGHLWVLIGTPDPDWQDAVSWDKHPDGPGRMTVNNFHGVYDTVIDIIDMKNRQILASYRVDPYLLDFAAPDEVYAYDVAEDGTPHITVWRVQHTTPDAR